MLSSYEFQVLIIGLAVIMTNIGARYIFMDINRRRERLLGHPMMRYFYIFCMGFVGTRDPKVSLIIVALYYLFMRFTD